MKYIVLKLHTWGYLPFESDYFLPVFDKYEDALEYAKGDRSIIKKFDFATPLKAAKP